MPAHKFSPICGFSKALKVSLYMWIEINRIKRIYVRHFPLCLSLLKSYNFSAK